MSNGNTPDKPQNPGSGAGSDPKPGQGAGSGSSSGSPARKGSQGGVTPDNNNKPPQAQ